MATTIIDKLIVELGLDPKQFSAGTKQAATDTKTMQDQVSYSAGEMVAAIHRVAAEFVGLFLTVRGVSDLVGMFAGLNENVRQLGIESRNLGESAAELRDWGNVAELAGGKAGDAAQSIQGLEKSIFNVKQGFGWDDQLTNFGRLGVDTGAAIGKMRDFHAILLDTAKALQGKSGADKFNWTQQLGLTGGIANAVTLGPAEVERLYAKAKAIPQVNGADTLAAQRLAEAFALLRQRVVALATKILTAVGPALERLFNTFGGFLSKNQGKIGNGIDDIAAWALGPGPNYVVNALTGFAQAVADAIQFFHYIGEALHPWRPVGKVISGAFQGAVDANKLDNQEAQVAREKEAASAKYGLPANFWTRDNTPLAPGSVDAYAAIIAQQHAALGGDAADPTWDKAYAALAARNRALSGPNPTALKATQGASASPLVAPKRKKAAGTPTASAGVPTAANGAQVTVGDIFVQTQAKDAHDVAGRIGGALQRKVSLSQGDLV